MHIELQSRPLVSQLVTFNRYAGELATTKCGGCWEVLPMSEQIICLAFSCTFNA